MRKVVMIFAVCLLLALPVLAQRDVRAAIHEISSYIVYYGEGRADDLARYDLAIVQPYTLDADALAELEAQGTLVAAYISIGEADDASRAQSEWILGKNENWDSYFIDAREQGWQDLIIAEVGALMDAGFDGVFLDTVDTADLYPQTEIGMIELIRRLRDAYPDALLIQNRGFGLLERTVDQIDAVMLEDLITGYDFDTENYLRMEADAEVIDLLHDMTREHALVVLALDYVASDDAATACLAVQAARAEGFIPAVSVILLDDLPDYGLEACPG